MWCAPHTRRILTLFWNGAQSKFRWGEWDLAVEHRRVIKEGKARFRLRWLCKQAAGCYSWLCVRDHKSKEIRTAKVPEKWMCVIMLSCGLDLLDRPTTPWLQANRKGRKKGRFWRTNFVRRGMFLNTIIKMSQERSRILDLKTRAKGVT